MLNGMEWFVERNDSASSEIWKEGQGISNYSEIANLHISPLDMSTVRDPHIDANADLHEVAVMITNEICCHTRSKCPKIRF